MFDFLKDATGGGQGTSKPAGGAVQSMTAQPQSGLEGYIKGLLGLHQAILSHPSTKQLVTGNAQQMPMPNAQQAQQSPNQMPMAQAPQQPQAQVPSQMM